jgi:hypothetical protein
MLPADSSRTRDLLWLVAAIGFSLVWCVTAGQRLGATFDEPIYLQRGLEGWRDGSHRGLLKLGTMPLPADVQTLPLYVIERVRGTPWNLNDDFGEALAVARIMTLPFWWLLLVYGWRIGRSVAGPWGGNLAVSVLACEPNLLAHASLATTDIAVTACLAAFAFHYQQGRDANFGRRVLVPGAWYGVALLAKASALVFGPLCMLAIELHRKFGEPAGLSRRDKPGGSQIRSWLSETIQIGLVGLTVTFLFCGSDWQPEPSFVAWANGLPEGGAKSVMVWLADYLCIFSNAGEGIARQIKHNMRGHGTYLLGQDSASAIWYYFPVLFTIKLTVPMLLAIGVVISFRARSLFNWPTFCAAVLFLFSLNCRVQIGIRLVLPCVALAAIGISAAIVSALQLTESVRARAMLKMGSLAGVAWMAIGSVAIWPDGLGYINEFWGGRQNGYQIVSDSNYDWGQGLPDLADWKRQHAASELGVWYFGTDPRLRQFPIQSVPLHVLPIRDGQDVRTHAAGRLLAVGTTVLYGHGLTENHRKAAEYLRTCTPVGRTSTFLIFDFTDSRSARANESGPLRAGSR